MAKPAILAVDDDPQVLQAVHRDLQGHYGDRFRVLRADSGKTALQLIERLVERDDPLALILSDQRMPEMNGTEFLERSIELKPDAKRVLLTAYSDTEAAIKAINQSKIHYYLTKPWDPPEERLFPVLDDLTEEWLTTYRAPFEGIRVIGHRWSAQAYELKDFLARNGVPYLWFDLAQNSPETQKLVQRLKLSVNDSPYVVLAGDEVLQKPTPMEVANKVGLTTTAKQPFYDLVIVGAGPAGLAAAVYAASEGLTTLMIDSAAPGGQAGTSSRIENYLGFPSGLSGADLTRRAVTQATRFGVEMLTPQRAVGVKEDGQFRIVRLGDGSEVRCKAVILATGVTYNQLDQPGVQRLTGAGVYYGAVMTEAMSCQDEEAFVVGAGNSAGQGAMYLSRYAKNVHMIVRRDSLSYTMSHYLIQQIEETANISVWVENEIVDAFGEENLKEVEVVNRKTGEKRRMKADAMFIFIGAQPCTDWLGTTVARDEKGFLLTGQELVSAAVWKNPRAPFLLETSMTGVFATGDVRASSVKRVASAVGEGSIAIQFVHQYLANL
jgi:thioredoxin reductase (NADPH)